MTRILVLFLLFSTPLFAAQRLALIVSANDGGKERIQLRYADKDAKEMASALQQVAGLRAEDILLIPDAKRSQVLEGLKKVRQILASDPEIREFLFYYSGHSDDEGLLLGKSKLGYQELKDAVNDLGSKVRVMILDSCASGTLARIKGGTQQKSFLTNTAAESSGFAAIMSSSDAESSQESERLKSSFFTHFLLSGMRGAADSNGDRMVSLGELYQFAYNETLASTSGTRVGAQHPTYDFQLKGQGDFIVSDLRQVSSLLKFPLESSGRYLLKNNRGAVVSEMTKTASMENFLALEAGNYELIRQTGFRYQRAQFSLAKAQTLDVGLLKFESMEAEKVAIRGDDRYPEFVERRDFKFALWPESRSEAAKRNKELVNVLLSPGIAYVPWVSGLGLAGVGAITDEFDGWALALGFHQNRGLMRGLQMGLGMNESDGLRGLQVGGLNYARDLTGGQLGVINIVDQGNGGQIGLVNVASVIKGFQIGLINIADRVDGLSLAPIVYVRDGILQAQAWLDPLGFLMTSLISGGSYYYSGLHAGSDGKAPQVGVAFGLRLPLNDGAFYLDRGYYEYQKRQSFPRYIQSNFSDATFSYGRDVLKRTIFDKTRLYYAANWKNNLSWMLGIVENDQRLVDDREKRMGLGWSLSLGMAYTFDRGS